MIENRIKNPIILTTEEKLMFQIALKANEVNMLSSACPAIIFAKSRILRLRSLEK